MTNDQRPFELNKIVRCPLHPLRPFAAFSVVSVSCHPCACLCGTFNVNLTLINRPGEEIATLCSTERPSASRAAPFCARISTDRLLCARTGARHPLQAMTNPQQQTWAEWLLDSYAASSPVTAESIHYAEDDSDESRAHSDDSPMSATSQSAAARSYSAHATSSLSPYGPYNRVGRGGAGNFHWQTTATNTTQDLETAQHVSLSERRTAAAKLQRINTEQIKARNISSQYVHVGRGGAGNLAQGTEIHLSKSPISPNPRSVSTPTIGRGGAGNVGKMEEQKRQLRREQEDLEKIVVEKRREKVEQEVDSLLMPPPGAFLGGNRRPSFADDV
jgi:hypothetical protein